MRNAAAKEHQKPGQALVPGLAVALFTVAAYSNSLKGIFVFDDIPRILESTVTRAPDLDWRGLFLFARPLSDLTLHLNYRLGALNPAGYHIFNLAIHVTAALVLMGFARACFALAGCGETRSRHLSFAVALLWAVHPIQTQAVTYIYQRAESTAGLLFLATMYCAARGLAMGGNSAVGRRWLAASLLACATGHLCKQTLFMAPFAVLVFDYSFFGGTVRDVLKRSRAYYSGLALTWLVGAALILATRMDDTVGYSIRNVPMPGYALSQPGVILHYLRLSLWPDVLLLNYHWPVARSFGAVLLPVTALLALFATVVYALAQTERRWRAQGFAGAWFFITLALSSSLFPIKDLAFEHRMYLALAAVVSFVVVVADAKVPGERARLALLLAAACALGIRTYLRNEDYNSSYSIWGGVLAMVPDDPRALNELGNACRDGGRLAEALALYERAIQVDPENPGPHVNAGLVQFRMGNLSQASEHYHQALSRRPVYPEARLNLGNVLAAEGRSEEALIQYQAALEARPDFVEALMAKANTLAEGGRFEEALQAYSKALSHAPDRFEIYSDVGTAFFKMGRFEEALRYYLESLRKRPDSAEVHVSAARTLRKLGREREAAEMEERAKQLMLR
jgi:protein O-mannosyl-transferase